jgi:putative peptidoglycan lipid II flippase
VQPAPIRLLKGFATVGGWTMASRVLGLLRDVLMAAVLGAGPAADAFFVAFRLPNMFRRFFAEGAFNMAFVPLFAKRLEAEGPAAARGFAEEALAALMAAVGALSALAMIFMPALAWLLAAGFADEPAKFDLTVALSRVQFPYLACMAALALASGALNALGRFAAPAGAPVLLNLALIAAMALGALTGAAPEWALSWGVLAAGFLQLGFVGRALWRAGMPLRLRRPRLTPSVRRMVALGAPGLVAGGVVQINLVIGTAIASFYDGAVAWLTYADRLYQLPLGVVGVAVGVVLLPELSRRLAAGDAAAARAATSRATEFAMALTLPAAVALAVAPWPIVATLFERGAFTAADAEATGWALALYALGLPAFVQQKVAQPAFFAREDTVRPLRYAAASMALNTAVSALGAPLVGWLAIPAGTSLAAWLNLWLLMRGARAYGEEGAPDARLRERLPKLLAAAVAMGVALILTEWALWPWFRDGWLRFPALGMLVGVGLAAYAIAALGTGGLSLADLKASLRRRQAP